MSIEEPQLFPQGFLSGSRRNFEQVLQHRSHSTLHLHLSPSRPPNLVAREGYVIRPVRVRKYRCNATIDSAQR
jgi:hypothetical protein